MEREEIEDVVALTEIITENILSKFDLIPENLSEPKAHKIYGAKNIEYWRRKEWIVAYPSANKSYAKVYYKRSECERARLMKESIQRRTENGIEKTKRPSSIMQIKEEIRNQIMQSQLKSQHNEKSKNYKAIPVKL